MDLGALALKIEKLDEKGFDELVQAMTMADKAFFIDLYRYQESVLLKASAHTAGHEKDDPEESLASVAMELRALGASLPRVNQDCFFRIEKLVFSYRKLGTG